MTAPLDRWALAGVVLLVSALVLGAVAVVASPDDADGAGARGGRGASPGASGRRVSASDLGLDPEFDALLTRIEHAWHPEEKQRLAVAARNLADRYRASFDTLLASGDHPRIRNAIELAGTLQLVLLAPRIRELAERGPPSVRASAIVASHQLGACTFEDLEVYLEDPEPEVLRAALDVAAKRDDLPLPQVAVLLDHEDPTVRRAALEALPAELDAFGLAVLLDVARRASDEHKVDVAVAVGRVPRVAESEEFLIDCLHSPDAAVRDVALDALGIAGEPLHRSDDVWRFVIDAFGDPAERARALLCIERSGPIRTDEIRWQMSFFDPFLQYFAARCLVTAGDRAGAEALIRILDDADASAGGGHELVYATRRLLSDVSRLPHESDVAAWREWLGGLSELAPCELAAPPIELGGRSARR